ncbi:MAG: DUF5008 domain-containing protein [Chitinophagaceae bacterium]|nr:MAG: DUF5008 domain-containing protein [Chitinophagaceae bacterium]
MTIKNITIALLTVSLLASCNKDIILAEPVYPPAQTLDFRFTTDKPVPATVNEGGTVTYKAVGLKAKEGKFKFFISGIEAEIISLTDNDIMVRVPQGAITSNPSILFEDKIIYGPLLKVNGDIVIDPNFSVSGSRANGPTFGMVTSPTGYYVYGSFSNFNNQATVEVPIRGVANVNASGNWHGTQYITNRVFDGGAVRDMHPVGSDFIVSGDFSSYFIDNIGTSSDKRYADVFGIAGINNQGAFKTQYVDIINEDLENENGGIDTVSAINGGVENGSIVKSFITTDNKYVLVGNFRNYVSVFYPSSTKIARYMDRVLSANNIRINADGSFDSTYNYSFANKAGYGIASGNILDAVKLNNDDIIIVGSFNQYQNVSTNYIAKIKNSDGRIDETFNNGQAGANGQIQSVTYNKANGKLLLAGTFTKYNNVDVNGVVMINADGSIDPSFQFATIKGGTVNYAKQIAYKNIVVVSGSFTTYDDKPRPGLIFLDNTGKMINGYNRFGLFRGDLNSIYEITDSNTGLPTLFLMGSFNMFDNTEVGNFLKINFVK